MRIGIDISKALGPLDGIGRYSRGLLAGLAASDGDHRFRLWGLLEPLPTDAPERLATLLGGADPRFELVRAAEPGPGEVDVFHGPAYALPAREGVPTVLTLHDLTFLSHPHLHTAANRLHCLRGLIRALVGQGRFVAVSAATRAEAGRLLGLDPARVDVVPPAAGEAFGPVDADEVARVCARRGLTRPYLLTLGVLEPRKNLRGLLAAFAALPAALRAGLTLAVAGGGGWLGEDPRAWPEAQALGATVAWLGEVPEADLPALYAGATAFAYPSLFEGFGLPPLEALACGVPVLTSDVSSLPEVVGEAAVLVDPTRTEAVRDGLARLLGDSALRARLAAAGPERARLFSWQRMGREMLEVYRRAAGEV